MRRCSRERRSAVLLSTNLEGLTLPVVAVANAKTLPHVNVLNRRGKGQTLRVSILGRASAEEEEEEEEKREKDASHAAKDVNKIDQRKKGEQNTAVVDAFSGDTPLKVRRVAFQLRFRTALTREEYKI